MIQYTLSKSHNDLQGILDLQKMNFKTELSDSEMREEGFLSLTQELPELEMICGSFGHVVAKDKDRVIGYALIMLREFKDKVPVLIPMFDLFDKLDFGNKRITDLSFCIMGQVCIDKKYRRKGIFKSLYRKFRDELKDEFEVVITEVATRNLRSMSAHRAVGFKPLTEYVSPENEEWALVYWDWN